MCNVCYNNSSVANNQISDFIDSIELDNKDIVNSFMSFHLILQNMVAEARFIDR